MIDRNAQITSYRQGGREWFEEAHKEEQDRTPSGISLVQQQSAGCYEMAMFLQGIIDLPCSCCGKIHSARGNDDPWEGRLDGYCYDCSSSRCDAFPGEHK